MSDTEKMLECIECVWRGEFLCGRISWKRCKQREIAIRKRLLYCDELEKKYDKLKAKVDEWQKIVNYLLMDTRPVNQNGQCFLEAHWPDADKFLKDIRNHREGG